MARQLTVASAGNRSEPSEPREARLEFRRDGGWVEAAKAPVEYPGWSAHFRVEKWDSSKTVPYRVRHGDNATFEGTVRRDPIDKDVILVANMSCNSSRTTGGRPEIVHNLLAHDPDLLFFAGDQTYRHTEHTAGWIEFGLQFRDVLKDRSFKGGEDASREVHPVHAMAAVHLLIWAPTHEPASSEGTGRSGLAGSGDCSHQDAGSVDYLSSALSLHLPPTRNAWGKQPVQQPS